MENESSRILKIGYVLVAIFFAAMFGAIAYKVFCLNEDKISYHIGAVSFGSTTGLGIMLSLGVFVLALIYAVISRLRNK